jgi:hypothetical protein
MHETMAGTKYRKCLNTKYYECRWQFTVCMATWSQETQKYVQKSGDGAFCPQWFKLTI